jgi:festuclavine dehydrogenase
MSKLPTIIVTGGTGKVGSALVPILQEHGYPVLVASRKGNAPTGPKGFHFNWTDSTTFEPLLNEASNTFSVFLISLNVDDPVTPMKTFTDLAISKGAKRFVLMSATAVETGGSRIGRSTSTSSTLK